jgi:phosphoglucosamine mutase
MSVALQMTDTSKRQLFGTDGIRGVASEFPLTQESVFAIGKALGHDLIRSTPTASVVIGQDTRHSSGWIADRLTQGLVSAGCKVESAGIITTPGVAYLARSRNFSAGVVISASHNPWTDNGIKFFSGSGFKLPDAEELEIEREIFALLKDLPTSLPEPPIHSLPGNEELRKAYISWLVESVHADLSYLRVLVDCANGAATAEAPALFGGCGVEATYLNVHPDGRNINKECGALHPEHLAAAMASMPGVFDLGVTFDGDADRALLCDSNGRIVNGDGILLVAARDLTTRHLLTHDTVVATTMSNMGLEVALRDDGIRLLRANVGDKYVLEEMQKTGAILGGEQSGHILFRDGEATTGDGLLTALRVMEVMVRTGNSLADLLHGLKTFPQVIRNVRVREKVPLANVPEVQQAIVEAEKQLEGNGRVVVRYSGTEALVRVMIEAETEATMSVLATSISDAIQRNLGV